MTDNPIAIRINLLDHPIIFTSPKYIVESDWTEHIPMSMLLIDLLKPQTLVELGTREGVLYCAFCQTVQKLHLATSCSAVGIWEDVVATGHETEILHTLRDHHDPRYGSFSKLIGLPFSQALNIFADGSIDLLHMNGEHLYENFSHHYNSWLPKLSDRGVIVVHHINEYHEGYEIWKQWRILKNQYPTFEVLHGHGLGVVAVGDQIIDENNVLFNLNDKDQSALNRALFRLSQASHRTINELEVQERLVIAKNAIAVLRTDKQNLQTRLDSALEKLEQQEASRHILETEYRQLLADLKHLRDSK